MQNFLSILAVCSITMSVVALLFLFFSQHLFKTYSVKWQYYAWLVIVIGFIIPFRPHFDFTLFQINIPIVRQEVIQPMFSGNPVQDMAEVTVQAQHTDVPAIPIEMIIGCIWLAGMGLVVGYHILRHFRFMKMVNRWGEEVSDEEILVVLQGLKNEMGIAGKVKLQQCSCIEGPMMVGFITPTILLPTVYFSKNELVFILKHELVHFKRKDLWYKGLVLVATAIHWFNPIIYLISKVIGMLCEMSCDAEVVRSAAIDTRQQYSETVIGVIRYQARVKTSLSTNFYGGKQGMKNRISTIMDTTKKRTGITILSGVLIVTMGTGMVFAASSSYPNITAVTQGSAFEASDVAETQVQSSAPMAESYTYKTDGNGASEASVRLYESEADIFTVYEKFGLIYNKENNRLYYNNKLVRYFEDNRKTDGTFYGTVSQNVDGDVDVHSVRNSAGDLTGVEPYTQAEFDAGITHKKTA